MNKATLAGSQTDGLSKDALRLASPARPILTVDASSMNQSGSVKSTLLCEGAMKVTQKPNGDQTWSVFIDGKEIISHESYTIASRIADALVYPEHETASEFGEVADALRAAYERNGGIL